MKKIIYIFLFLIFLFSSLNLTIEFQTRAIYFVYSLLILATIIVPVLIKNKKNDINMPFSVVMFSFLLTCGISSFVNSDIRLLISSLIIIVLYITSCIIFPMTKLEINPIIFKSFLMSHALLILVPLIFNGINELPYRGIFYNTNSFGTVAVTVFVILLALLLADLEVLIKKDNAVKGHYRKIHFFILLISLIISFYFIVISSSRTSFLTGVLCIILGIGFLLVYLIKHKKIGNLIVRGGFFSIISIFSLILITKFTTIEEAIYNNVINKFILRANESSGVLSSRDDIWLNTISEAKLFGNGNNYFTDMGIGAHNTFISILGQYGWVPLSIFILIIILILYFNLKYLMSNVNNKYKFLPLMLLFSFLTMSMGEDMTFKASMILMFFSFGEALKIEKMAC